MGGGFCAASRLCEFCDSGGSIWKVNGRGLLCRQQTLRVLRFRGIHLEGEWARAFVCVVPRADFVDPPWLILLHANDFPIMLDHGLIPLHPWLILFHSGLSFPRFFVILLHPGLGSFVFRNFVAPWANFVAPMVNPVALRADFPSFFRNFVAPWAGFIRFS